MNSLYEPWPWYVAGPLIALVMFLLLFVGKKLGMSSNLRTVCSAVGGNKVADFFDFDWKAERWNLILVLGTILGGFIASYYLSPSPNAAVAVNPEVASLLAEDYNIKSAGQSYLPTELFGTANMFDLGQFLLLLIGGILVGFGARYAGGCTSGHAISGLSNLQLPSLLAVVGFFIGGLFMVHLLFPLLF